VVIVGSGGAGPPGTRRRRSPGVTLVSGPLYAGAEEAVVSQEAVPQQGAPAPPKGLLQQMEELMAALNADLSQLDADLSGPRPRLPTDPDRL